MAITTTPTAAMKAAIKAAFVTQFGGAAPPSTEDAIATAMAEVIAVAIQQALLEVKSNADLTGVSSGSATVSGGGSPKPAPEDMTYEKASTLYGEGELSWEEFKPFSEAHDREVNK